MRLTIQLACKVVAGMGFLLLATFGPGACTYVPFDAPRNEVEPERPSLRSNVSHRIDRDVARAGGRSGFIPLLDGNDALGARLSMIEAAEQRIDIQSFLIKPDKAGSLVSLALLDAAERGVAVRLLVDDVFSTASDEQLALLASSPRIDVRLFNPLSRRSPAAMNYLLDFGRVNRRMHNKAFIVDRSMAIVGGRNIADEYFRIDTETEFSDFDVFVAGPVVSEMDEAFELYWNDRWSVPVKALTRRGDGAAPAEVKRALKIHAETAAAGIYQQAVGSSYLERIRSGRVAAKFGHAHAVTDDPSKLKVPVREGERLLAEMLFGQIATARSQVTILTPYFVPEDWGANLLIDATRRGVRVRVVTNSLAATNHPYVHGGYMRHRADLLAAGVELYEVRADAPEVLGVAPPGEGVHLTMHTKLAIIDDRTSFIGSLNFDPRSIKLNSEFGVFVDSREIASAFLREIDEDLRKYTFKLRLEPNGGLLWVYQNRDLPEVFAQEPGAGLVRKATARLTTFLPVEGQL
ncbi:phospholipase D family protein [Rhodobacteraceae bacterium DSL-40]|uniref:phospholipase D family protein n=1 Tax=Amaricoccus sp. B4 TaxID=3368557 RepID=UPI000DAB9F6F